jgi:hypothetical protein
MASSAIVLYNILHPTVDNTAQFRSEDEQVNGMGLYRTLVGGTTGLLIEREPFPTNPPYSVTGPADAAAIDGAQLLMQFVLFDSTTNCFATQRWELLQLSNTIMDYNETSEDATGRRATYRWEIDQQNIEQTWFWMYEDISVDNALGSEIELDNNVPVANNILSIFQEHAFLSGDPFNPHYLYWSKRFRPESWPVENFVEIGTAADPIRQHLPIAGVLGVFTTQTKYRVTGNATSGFVHDEAISHRGAPSPRSVIASDQGVIFVARDGVFVTNFIGADRKLSDAIDPIFLGEDKNEYDKINWDAADQICAAYYKNKYYFSYPSGTNTTNNITAIYSIDTEGWTFWGTGYASFYAEKDTDFFLAGGYDGIVRIIEDQRNASDNGDSIEFELQTHDFTTDGRNLFTHFIIDAECHDDKVTVEFYADNELVRSTTITGSRTNDLLSLPTDSFGYKWRMRVSYTGTRRIAVYGVTAIYIPLLAA